MIMSVPVAVIVTIPDSVIVTSVPVELFNVTGDDAPVYDKSVDPPPPAASMVMIPSDPVPVVVNVMFEPSTNFQDPPPSDNVAVCDVPSLVFAIVCNSLVIDPSTSVAVTVTAPAVCEITAIPEPVIDHVPPPSDNVFVYVVVPA